jgi:hypothetical protein
MHGFVRMDVTHAPPNRRRDELTRQANALRSNLIQHIDALGRRRRQALDPRVQLRRHFRGVLLGAGVAVLLAAGGLAFAAYKLGERRSRRGWLPALVGAWRRPDAPREARSRGILPAVAKVAKSALLSLAVAAVKQAAVRATAARAPAE